MNPDPESAPEAQRAGRPGTGAAVVRAPRAVFDAIVDHAHAASPAECCGVLLGSDGRIAAAVPTVNRSHDPNRFIVDPQGHMDARREARRLGIEVVGFYHSHVRSSARPSDRDLAEASYPGHLYVIVSLATEDADMRVFRFESDRFAEVELVWE